ncbi:ATP-binding protein [Ramlibacter sp. MMS24-I3-19]|uniref:hybrid sensor histidine kinase/response regulator n=1 Tax=Ramlibacter sp. MMS24-I3-19 TaxID=3416606 RepID=UPI003D06F7A5
MDIRRLPRERFPRHSAVALGLTVLAWLLVATAVAADLWADRQREIGDAERAASATTALMEAHTARTFQVVDLALQEVARRVDEAPLRRHDPRLREVMRERLQGMDYVRALFVIGPDGFIQHDTDYPGTPDVSLADRDYFLLHRRNPSQVTSISSPLRSRSGTGWFVAATRRIGDGRVFKGIAVAAIQLQSFSDLYQRMGLGEGHQIVLFHEDGRLIAQHPMDPSRIGQTYADYPLFRDHLPSARRGVYLTAGPPLPYERIFSYEKVSGQPLVVGLSYATSAVLAPWRRAAITSAAGLALLLAVMLVAVLMFLREQQRQQRLRERQLQGEKLEALGQLTGSIAHDVANMMGIVAGNLEIVRRAAADRDGTVALAVARAQHALDNGASMTRQLLSFARARPLEVVELDLHALLRDVLPLLEQAAGPGVKLELVLGDPGHCRADSSQVEVALINLVVNARHAMGDQGTVVVRTSLIARTGARGWWRPAATVEFLDLTVEDDGPGMPDDVRRRALEPFFTTKGESGTGLDLAQVYGLMRQLGGDVEIDSRPGRGTAVHLLFPVQRA